ncbi:MAG TPA: biotin transporter BioY, partial [Firmicutes bacterium]|nr:biotin transporter BioY [Bacillota bacterium]
MCGLFSALIAVGAFIKIPIPVVPFTLQVLFTMLAALLLGARLGALSVGIYVLIGLLGLPVFTKGGGLSYIFQPTFGYLIGFIVGAFVTGVIAHKKKDPTFKSMLVGSLMGLLIVYLFGTVYYYVMANYYLQQPVAVWTVFVYCFLVFIPGDVFSCFVASKLSLRLLPHLKQRG